MKKVLPLLLFVLLAFAGCQPSGPVEYQIAHNPHQVALNAENFVQQTVKKSRRYKAEDWQMAVDQFITMSKNYYEYHKGMTQEEVSRFDAARLEFMKAVNAHGSEELAIQIKEAYGKIVK